MHDFRCDYLGAWRGGKEAGQEAFRTHEQVLCNTERRSQSSLTVAPLVRSDLKAQGQRAVKYMSLLYGKCRIRSDLALDVQPRESCMASDGVSDVEAS